MRINKRGSGAPTIQGPAVLPAPIVYPRTQSVATQGFSSSRTVEMEITDTAEGKCRPILYGRFRQAFPLVHADIPGGIELIALLGEGPIAAVEKVWVDEEQIYPSVPAWATCQVKLGGSWTSPATEPDPSQTAVTNIANTTIKDWTHPGQAYVSITLNLGTAPIQGAIPRVEVQGRGILCDILSSGTSLWAWTENPIWHLADALRRREYGAGFDRSSLAIGSALPHSGFTRAAEECDVLVDYDALANYGQTSSNQQLLLSTYDRLQTFKCPGGSFRIEVKIRTVAADGNPVFFPMVLRTTAGGADIPPDSQCDPITPTVDGDFILWGKWNEGHGFDINQTLYLVSKSGAAPGYTSLVLPGNGDDVYHAEYPTCVNDWSNPTRIEAADGNEASSSHAWGPVYTKFLQGTQLGFAIPAGSTINGIEVRVGRRANARILEGGDQVYVKDTKALLLKAGALTLSGYPNLDAWATGAGEEVSYGGPTSMWGTTWTPAEVNAANFGFALSALLHSDYSMAAIGYVDYFKVKIYYTLAGGGQPANTKWHHNSVNDLYADGKAQYYSAGSWHDQNYDHWFQTYISEEKYRCSLSIIDRQPIEQVAQAILRTCHGRLGWWDGFWQVTLDELAESAGTLSDDPDDSPDYLIIGGSLVCGTDDADIPNFAAGTYLDTDDWLRKTVRYQHATYEDGSEQPKELRADSAPCPSGGQLYRMLATWIQRARNAWRGSCKVDQSGIQLAPGDLLTLSSFMFTGTRVVMIEDVRDNEDGTFTLSFCKWSLSDFFTGPYIAQTTVATVTSV